MSAALQEERIADLDISAHIVLESPEEQERSAPEQPRNIAAEYELNSRLAATRVRLALYEEGFLAVRTRYGNKPETKLVLDLRHIDPKPMVSRITARRTGHFCLWSVGLSGLLGLLGSLGVMPTAFFSAALAMTAGAAFFAWLFLCRTGERVSFRTANGSAEVLTLFGTVGTIRELRRIVPALAASIRSARELGATEKRLYLRREIREHYRLAQAGIISDDDCSTCTRRILSNFD